MLCSVSSACFLVTVACLSLTVIDFFALIISVINCALSLLSFSSSLLISSNILPIMNRSVARSGSSPYVTTPPASTISRTSAPVFLATVLSSCCFCLTPSRFAALSAITVSTSAIARFLISSISLCIASCFSVSSCCFWISLSRRRLRFTKLMSSRTWSFAIFFATVYMLRRFFSCGSTCSSHWLRMRKLCSRSCRLSGCLMSALSLSAW